VVGEVFVSSAWENFSKVPIIVNVETTKYPLYALSCHHHLSRCQREENGWQKIVFKLHLFIIVRISGLGWPSRYSDSLRPGGSGDRTPAEARFSALFQTGPWAQLTSCTMHIGYWFGEKRPECGIDHPPTVKNITTVAKRDDSTATYRKFPWKVGFQSMYLLFEYTVPNLITRSDTHMFRFHLKIQRRRRRGCSEKQGNVVLLILRLLTNHILLIIINVIDSQIYSQPKL
jgi:hypothetical protein